MMVTIAVSQRVALIDVCMIGKGIIPLVSHVAAEVVIFSRHSRIDNCNPDPMLGYVLKQSPRLRGLYDPQLPALFLGLRARDGSICQTQRCVRMFRSWMDYYKVRL
jgi:hypothetical protein